MKVIFLDVDGVLNSVRSTVAQHDKFLGYEGFMGNWKWELASPAAHQLYNHIDPIAVALINRLTTETNAKLCISSTHRKHVKNYENNLEDLQLYFRMLGLTGEVVGATPCLSSSFRGSEIAYWLLSHPEVTSYVIVDDDSDMLESQKEFFVHTNNEDGFSYANYVQAYSLLK
jgi:hypothetical protein